MDKLRLNRSALIAEAPPIELWPLVPEGIVEDEVKELFNQRCKAIEMYLNYELGADIQKATNVHKTTLSNLLQKCLELGPDGNILGFNALIPFVRIKDYERTAEVKPKFREDQGGLSGLLQQTLTKYPDLEKKLNNLILKKNSLETSTHERKISAKQLHQVFLKLLKEKGYEDSDWPFGLPRIS